MDKRVCVVSQRNIRKKAAWGSLYEFEDVIADVEDVDRFDVVAAPGFSARQRLLRSVIWHRFTKRAALLNPGLVPITLDREYDIFFFGCISPWELLYLNAIRGWKEQCKSSVCYIYEMWPGMIAQYDHLLRLLERFDYVFVGLANGARALASHMGFACRHLSPAADVLRFSPFPNPPARSIDVLSIGRRVGAIHGELVKMRQTNRIFYLHDTLPADHVQPDSHVEHRDLVASCSKRARFLLAYPAKFDTPGETKGESEPGTRFYEGVASGAVLLGSAPTSDVFRTDFGWPDSMIEIGDDATRLSEILSSVESERFVRASKSNSVEALSRHDWGHRWRDILAALGRPPSALLAARIDTLGRLAG